MSRSTFVILLLSWILFCQSTSTSAQDTILSSKDKENPTLTEPDRQPRKSALHDVTSCIGTNERTYREDPNDDLETKLLKEKIRAASIEFTEKANRYGDGSDSIFHMLDAQKRLIASLLDFHTDPADAIPLMKKNIEVAKQVEEHRNMRLAGGIDRPDDHARAVYFRADAELQLLRYQRENKKAP